jgi:hypothetical protein
VLKDKGIEFGSPLVGDERSIAWASAHENRFLNENLGGVGAGLFAEQDAPGRRFRSANERKDEA